MNDSYEFQLYDPASLASAIGRLRDQQEQEEEEEKGDGAMIAAPEQPQRQQQQGRGGQSRVDAPDPCVSPSYSELSGSDFDIGASDASDQEQEAEEPAEPAEEKHLQPGALSPSTMPASSMSSPSSSSSSSASALAPEVEASCSSNNHASHLIRAQPLPPSAIDARALLSLLHTTSLPSSSTVAASSLVASTQDLSTPSIVTRQSRSSSTESTKTMEAASSSSSSLPSLTTSVPPPSSSPLATVSPFSEDSSSASSSSSSSSASSSARSRTAGGLCCLVCCESFCGDASDPLDSCEEDHRPRMLPCAHMVCTDCCKNMSAAAAVLCPLGCTATPSAGPPPAASSSSIEAAAGPAGTSLEQFPLHHDAMDAIKKLSEVEEFRMATAVHIQPMSKTNKERGDGHGEADKECAECSGESVWYCTRCDANLCEVHGQSKLQQKHREWNLLLALADKDAYIATHTPFGTSLCKQHLLPESLLCTLCGVTCCQTCSLHSPEHKEHSNQVCTILDAIDVNSQRMREALRVDSEVTITRAMKKANDQKAEIDAFEQATNAQIDDEFRRLEERLRARKQILLQDVAHKSELLRSHVSSSVSELSHLRERLVLGREVLACLLGLSLRSESGLLAASSALEELEEVQAQLGAFHRADKPVMRGQYQSTFKPVMKELLSLGVVPDVTSSSSASSAPSSSFSPAASSVVAAAAEVEQKLVGYENHSSIGWQSRILQGSSQVQQLESLLGGVGPGGLQVELLYRGSRDGFSASSFHAHTDKRGSTLLLVRARETAQVFGALSVVDYESCDSGGWMIDPTGQSCIFSLVNSPNPQQPGHPSRPFKLQCVDHDRALFVRTASGPMIGGRDICLGGSGASFDAPDANSSAPSGSYESRRIFHQESHTVTHEVKYDSSTLAGSPTWSAAEVEVFALKPFGLLELLRYSRILRMLDLPHLARFFAGTDGTGALPHSPRLLYRASEHGFTPADFRARCTGRGATLTLVKVAGSNYCWGAFMVEAWPEVPAGEFFVPVLDPASKSFMFSLVNAHGRPLKLKLKTSAGPVAAVAGARRAAAGAGVGIGGGVGSDLAGLAAAASASVLPPPPYALYGHSSHGPVFGGSARLSPDVILGVRDESSLDGRASLPMDHPQGNSINTPTSYAIDEELEAQAGLPNIAHSVPPIVHDRRLLAGAAKFRVLDMEVFAVE